MGHDIPGEPLLPVHQMPGGPTFPRRARAIAFSGWLELLRILSGLVDSGERVIPVSTRAGLTRSAGRLSSQLYPRVDPQLREDVGHVGLHRTV